MARNIVLAVVLCIVALRVWMRLGRRGGRGQDRSRAPRVGVRLPHVPMPAVLESDIGLVAVREIRERTRGRVFRVGTIIILLAVAAGVVIPTLHHGSTANTERVGVVGSISSPLRQSIVAVGTAVGATVTVTDEADLATARLDLADGKLDLVLVDTTSILVKTAPAAGDTSTTTLLAASLAREIGLQNELTAAGVSAEQAAALTHPKPLPIEGLHPAHKARTGQAVTVYGLILLFVLLSQYGTWILLGVVEEKSSRVVEVLLATLRPRQLLAGKVLGIGIVALLQAAAILAVALGLGAAVGSDLVKGGNPTNVVSTVVWLVLGYVFSCWLYAAAGSLATRQEHVQTLAFPLQLPLLLGYIISLTAVSADHASTFVHVLAFIPPMSAFAMPALVALGATTWWQFMISVLISLGATVGLSRLAAAIYVRAILRTGQRVRLRELADPKPSPRPPAPVDG